MIYYCAIQIVMTEMNQRGTKGPFRVPIEQHLMRYGGSQTYILLLSGILYLQFS